VPFLSQGRVAENEHPGDVQQSKGDVMKNILRVVMVTVALSVTATVASPMPSFAWNQKEFSISGSDAPFMVLNQDQFKGKWKQFKGEIEKEMGEFH
jgi:hypothetical protein